MNIIITTKDQRPVILAERISHLIRWLEKRYFTKLIDIRVGYTREQFRKNEITIKIILK